MRLLATDLSFISSAKLCEQLNADVLGEWRDFRGRGQITEKQIAVLLGQFDVHPQVYHPSKRSTNSVRGYLITDFATAFHRYLPGAMASKPKRGKS